MRGKHVLVEKPITPEYNSAKELVNLANEKNLVLGVGYLFRFNPAVNSIKEQIKSIGEIQYITARFIHSNKPPRRDSGVIFNFGIHLFRLLHDEDELPLLHPAVKLKNNINSTKKICLPFSYLHLHLIKTI